MAETTRAEIVNRLNSGETQFSDEDWSGLDLSNIDFSGCNLHGINLTGADLTSAVADDADVSWANFTDAVLDGVLAKRARGYGSNRSYRSAENATIEEITDLEEMQKK